MTKLMKTLGRVMMTAVSLPRSTQDKYDAMQTYVKTEFQQGDRAYIMDCMQYGRPIDYRNIV